MTAVTNGHAAVEALDETLREGLLLDRLVWLSAFLNANAKRVPAVIRDQVTAAVTRAPGMESRYGPAGLRYSDGTVPCSRGSAGWDQFVTAVTPPPISEEHTMNDTITITDTDDQPVTVGADRWPTAIIVKVSHDVVGERDDRSGYACVGCNEIHPKPGDVWDDSLYLTRP